MIVVRTSPWHNTFRKTLDTLKEMKDCCDEIWLGVYGYYSLEDQEKRANELIPVVKEIKEAGFRPIMEFGSNFGHVPEGPVTEVTKDFEKMVGLNGQAATAAFCPRGKNFLAYERQVAKIFSRIHPWGMYIDDDLRIEFRNIVGVGCFCDNCIAQFNRENGYGFTREEISRRFVYDTDVRKKYIKFNNDAMKNYAYMMTKEMALENPGISAGWENCFLGAYNGENFRYVFDGLHEATDGQIMSRSGAFFYNDHCPRNMLDKVLNTSYQNSILPDFVTIRRPEIENTDFFAMGKSIQGTCTEATLNMALGCNGVSFHFVGHGIEPMEYRKRMFRATGDHRDYWIKLRELNKFTGVSGMRLAYFPDVYEAVEKDKKTWEAEAAAAGKTFDEYIDEHGNPFWWAGTPKESGRQMWQIGMPLSYEDKKCKAFLLQPDMLPYFSDKDIKKLLSSNVLTDGNAIMKLEEMGYGDYLPVTAKKAGDLHHEYYSDDEINGENAGGLGMTDCFVPASFQEFFLKDGKTWRILSRHANYPSSDFTEPVSKPEQVVSAVFDTSLGGKWGVIGSNLWCTLVNTDKRTGILKLCDYLTGGLAAYVKESEQAVIIPRTNDKDEFVCATIQSVSIGDTGEMTLAVKKPAGKNFILLRPGYDDISLESYEEKGETFVKVPAIRGWHVCTVVCG